MIYWLEVNYRKLRRWFNRSEWLIDLLGISKQERGHNRSALIIIQLDGLSHTQFQEALKNNRLPFLKNLLKHEHYGLHHFYSGVPSTTPAVQGELFYGVKMSVPAFSFKSKASSKIIRMDKFEGAFEVEEGLKSQAEGLLKGGSSYSNIFRGGAPDANFCSVSLGWASVMKLNTPLTLGIFVLLNLYSFVRTGVLMIVELLLAIIDFMRGMIARENLFRELKFVPTRVAISILLRELITIGVKLDVARGLPVIHLNFLGYDEQAHRRGPRSLFAHWSLKGIDDAIGRIWRAAKSSSIRDYAVWIYSDHGQEDTIPYSVVNGRTVTEAITEVFNQVEQAQLSKTAPVHDYGIQSQRAKYLGGTKFQKLFPSHESVEQSMVSDELAEPAIDIPIVTATGPLGSVYWPYAVSDEKRDEIARALIKTAKIPMVLTSISEDAVKVWNKNGEYLLPDDAALLLGAEHPFLQEATRDLIQLCQHKDSGDLLISGWLLNEPYITFAMENGSHGGPGPQESHGFVLLPPHTHSPRPKMKKWCPGDLRASALSRLQGKNDNTKIGLHPGSIRSKSNTLRILTYNVHSCIGMDGKLSPRRIASLISQYQPDVVALQELDVGKARTRHIDQAHAIAEYLEMAFQFHPSISVEEECYGNAILTHLPHKLIKAGNMPRLASHPNLESRGALWVSVDFAGHEINIINTHLGLRPAERLVQVRSLLGANWLSNSACKGPLVLCGDFNSFPNSPAYRQLARYLDDIQVDLGSHQPLSTFPGRYPAARIDHIFTNSMLRAVNIEVPRNLLSRTASDHLPLIADLVLNETPQM